MGTKVGIVLGSKSDQEVIEGSGMCDILNQCGVIWEMSIISAHRHPEKLVEYCKGAKDRDIRVFIGVAGMSAALPGVIAANIDHSLPVIGVPLSSSEFSGATDALLAMVRMPGGCPVAVPGIGKSGLKNAAILAAQILALDGDMVGREIKKNLLRYLQEHSPEAQLLVATNQKKEEDNDSHGAH